MDTDDLSEDAYAAVIIEAERFHHDLTLQFGLLAEDCSDEDEYLQECKRLILELKQLKPEDFQDIFFDDPPAMSDLVRTLDVISHNIDKVTSVPLKKRRFDF
jgi:hypothetical protein